MNQNQSQTQHTPFAREGRIRGKVMSLHVNHAEKPAKPGKDGKDGKDSNPGANQSVMVYIQIHITDIWDFDYKEWFGVLRKNFVAESAINIQMRNGEPNMRGWYDIYFRLGWDPWEDADLPISREVTADVVAEQYNDREKYRAQLRWTNRGDTK